jgi:ABC-type multidrug transport system fused ATPase/permease subunit
MTRPVPGWPGMADIGQITKSRSDSSAVFVQRPLSRPSRVRRGGWWATVDSWHKVPPGRRPMTPRRRGPVRARWRRLARAIAAARPAGMSSIASAAARPTTCPAGGGLQYRRKCDYAAFAHRQLGNLISITFNPGTVLGNVGPSGSGTSTLTKLIQRTSRGRPGPGPSGRR